MGTKAWHYSWKAIHFFATQLCCKKEKIQVDIALFLLLLLFSKVRRTVKLWLCNSAKTVLGFYCPNSMKIPLWPPEPSSGILSYPLPSLHHTAFLSLRDFSNRKPKGAKVWRLSLFLFSYLSLLRKASSGQLFPQEPSHSSSSQAFLCCSRPSSSVPWEEEHGRRLDDSWKVSYSALWREKSKITAANISGNCYNNCVN